MRVLLTGGLGYLGGRLAGTLAAAGHELTLATRRPTAAQGAAADFTVAPIDWSSDGALERLCEGMHAVVHLAGMNAADCERDPVAALEFNGVATARLVRAAIRRRVARFAYVSTAHVYGAALRGRVDERSACEPRHPYATSHRAGEDAVRLVHAARALEGIVVRLSNAFGAPLHPGTDCWSLVTNDLCRQAVTTRREVLRSAGTQRRDFVPLTEACRALAHLLSLPAERLGDGLFNVGGGWAPTLLEMAELIAVRVRTQLGFEPQVVTGAARERVGEDALDYSLAKLAATGFELRGEAIVAELDGLITYCAQHFGGPAT